MEVTNAQPDTALTLPKNVAELQGENVLFELECIDRMYLNLYVPQLASAPGVAAYFAATRATDSLRPRRRWP